jgi:hypothetical protein
VLSGALLGCIDCSPQFLEVEQSISPGSTAVLTKDGATVGILYPDTSDELQYTRKLFCLSIRGERHIAQITRPEELYKGEEVETSELVMGLVLKEDSEVEGGFKRIGLARWVKRSSFENSQ